MEGGIGFAQRAWKFIFRKKGKSLLLATLFTFAIFICLTGTTFLRINGEIRALLASNSRALVNVYNSDYEPSINEDVVNQGLELDNVKSINRFNSLSVVMPDPIEIGLTEPQENVVFFLQGRDDLELDGPFMTGSTQIVSGTLELKENEILVNEMLTQLNNWQIGTTIQLMFGENLLNGRIAGTYEGNDNTNAIYTSPEFINEFQEFNGYSNVSFLVRDPEEIQKTQQEVQELIEGSNLEVTMNDDLYQRWKESLDIMSSLAQLLLFATVLLSVIVISLLLSLWVRERRQEAALLMAIGEMKVAIICQQFIEVGFLFLVAIFIAVLSNNLVSNQMGTTIFQLSGMDINDLQLGYPNFQLSLKDILGVFVIGCGTILFSILISIIPILKMKPKQIFSSVD